MPSGLEIINYISVVEQSLDPLTSKILLLTYRHCP